MRTAIARNIGNRIMVKLKFDTPPAHFTWDALGFSASMLCAVHCAATPLLLSALPLFGASFLAHPALETAMIACSLLFGIVVLLHGYLRHHRKAQALVFLGAGVVLLGFAKFALREPYAEIAASLAGVAIACGHWRNWRLCKPTRCCQSA
jgi:hypothetical protein